MAVAAAVAAAAVVDYSSSCPRRPTKTGLTRSMLRVTTLGSPTAHELNELVNDRSGTYSGGGGSTTTTTSSNNNDKPAPQSQARK